MPALYWIFPSLTTVDEGQVLTTMVHTSGVASGTTLYWRIEGGNIDANDFSVGSLSGQGTIVNNASGQGMFMLSHTLANDLKTEGLETLQIKLFSDPARSQQLGQTATVNIKDTSLTSASTVPSYKVTPSVSTINEGLTLSTTVQTSNLKSGTTLYWSITGTGITAADFSGGSLTGSGKIDALGKFSLNHTLNNDLKTEGSETLEVKLFLDAARTKQVGQTARVVINDTSVTQTPTSPSIPSYSIKPSATTINEGQTLSTLIQTTNVAAGTILYWQFSGVSTTSAINDKDFSNGALKGSAAIDSKGQILLSHTLANDLTTEGSELLQIKLFSDAALTKQLGSTSFVNIADTSKTPATPTPVALTYSVSPSATQISEGLQLTTTIKTTGLTAGTQLYWQLSGTGTVPGSGITNADFSSGTLTGLGTIDASGQFVITHTVAADLTTEGNETLKITLFTDSALSKPVTASSVIILDTSVATGVSTYTLTPSLTTINEGQSVSTKIATTNVADRTILYYSVLGTVDPTDFSVGTISGQVVVQAGQASLLHTLSNDLKTEGDEVMQIQLFADKPGGTALGAPIRITVKDTSTAPVLTTEIYQPAFTPFAIKKWASAVPVPTLKRPDYVGTQPDIWGTNFAPQPAPGGQPALYQDVDPSQKVYGGIAPEYYDQTVAGTNTPYFTTGEATAWYSQREGAANQVVVDRADKVVTTEIYGYDSTMPGSTFKTKVGAPVVVRHWNDLPLYPGMPADLNQRESVHLHGGHNPAHTDGYPSYVINQGMYRDYYYANTIPMGNDGIPDIGESPSTMWYHDHGEDITDLNVIKGMAGFWLSYDDTELNLVKKHILPGWWKTTAEWNEQEFMENNSPYDIPLALSDRRFNADGSFYYQGFPIGPDTDGYLGDVMLVNGKSYPYLQVEQTQYRMRMLGASTARIWHLSIQDANGVMQKHLRVGNDTWLLPNPIEMTDFTISPAQRADVVMDFSGYAPGTVLYLVNTAEQNKGTGPQGKLDTIGTTGFSERVMKIVVGAKTATTPSNTITPTTALRENTPILDSEISNRRTFEFGRSNGLWLINQTHFDSQLVNNVMPVGVAEQWTLKNGGGGWWHPIHIHLESHQVVSIDGRAPGPGYFPEKEFKSDTPLLGPNTTAVVNMKFRTFEGPFVFHCHILQHEDSMMMFNFDPYVPSLNPIGYKEGDPIPADRNYTPFPYASAHHPGHILQAPPTATTAVATTTTPTPTTTAAPTAAPASTTAGGPTNLSPALLSQFGFIAYGTTAGEVIQGTSQNFYLNGGGGNDYLKGDIGNDMLVGGTGDDVLSGGNGDDLIAGEFGNDMLTGGRGRDGFYFVTADKGTVDIITDFTPGEDFISLHHAVKNTNGANATWSYIGAANFSGKQGEVRFSSGMLQTDLDGDGSSDINARLLGITSFDQSWLNVPPLATSV